MLTKFQQSILSEMREKGFILCTTEGSSYKCWLEDSSGTLRRILRKDTCIALASENKIKVLAECDYPQRYKRRNDVFCWGYIGG